MWTTRCKVLLYNPFVQISHTTIHRARLRQLPHNSERDQNSLSPILHTTQPGRGSALIHTPFSPSASSGTAALSFSSPFTGPRGTSEGSTPPIRALAALGARPVVEVAGTGVVAASSKIPLCGRKTWSAFGVGSAYRKLYAVH